MKPVFKFLAFLLILGMVGQIAKYQADHYEPEEFVVSDIRTVTPDCSNELVIRLPLSDCPLLAEIEMPRLPSLKSEINLALRLVLG
jgi:hypothetical protein